MNSVHSHPDEGVLLRYLDGELPARKSRLVRGHLEACWQCRTAAEDLEATVASCVHYRKNVLQAHLPPPPAPWADLSDGFAGIDSEAGVESWMARLGHWVAAPTARRWALSATAALLLAAGLFQQFRETPSVQAASLLHRAVTVAATNSRPARTLRMRTNIKNRAVVPAMLRSAHYDSEAPLSARSFQEWRDGLTSKRDQVTTVPDPESPVQNCYRIETMAADGELAIASMMLRATDLHPVEGRFEFRNRDWVEYNEISDASTTDGGTPAETRLDAPMRRTVPPSRSAALPSGEPASISEELQVLVALHEIGADLGEPVEVNHSGGRILVSGIGVSAVRQRDIHRALDSMPNVTVQFADPSGATSTADADAAPVGAKPSGIQARVEQHLGGRAEFERFSGQLLDAMDNAMARAYALRALSQRFPEGTEMSAADRTLLGDLARQHLQALTSQLNDLHRTLAPVLVSLGGSTAQGRPAKNQIAWQPTVEDVFQASRHIEVLLSTLLGVTPETPNAHVPTDLLAAFGDAKAALENLRSLL
jgi:anti-sigma factor RsiW